MAVFLHYNLRVAAAAASMLGALLVTTVPLQAQRTAAAVIAPGASRDEESAFVAAAEAKVASQVGIHRYIVVFRESGRIAGLRADEALPSVRREVVRATTSRLGRSSGVRAVRAVGDWPLAVVETDDAAAVVALLADPNVAAIEQDQWYVLQDTRESDAPADPNIATSALAQSTPWGVAMVGAPAAWVAGARGQGVKVGLLDSGGDVDHPDLIWAGGYDATGVSSTPTLPSAWDDNISVCRGHGTHVAGTVGARDNTIGVVGVAPEAALYAVKVFGNLNSSCGAWTSWQITGLNWMQTQGVRIASVSIGGSFTGAYSSTVKTLLDGGMLVVGSSGNNNSTIMSCPACFNASVAVGAITSSKVRASYSNYGIGLDLVAPGSGVSSTMPGGGTGSKSGTSMAAPHVAGVLALVLSRTPSLSVLEALSRVGGTAEDLGPAGWDDATAAGLVRADLAVGVITSTGLQISTPVSPVRIPMTEGVLWNSTSQVRMRIEMTGSEGMGTRWYTSTARGNAGVSGFSIHDPAMGTRSPLVLPGPNMSTTTPPGVYLDTLLVHRWGSGEVLFRAPLEVTVAASGIIPVNAVVSPTHHFASVRADSVPPDGRSELVLSGTNAATAGWSVRGGRWTVPVTSNGTGSAPLQWTRSTTGLALGVVHVDTLRVEVSGPQGSLARSIVDSLLLRPLPVTDPTTLTVDPSEFTRTLASGSTVVDSFRVVVTGPLASTTSWSASTSHPQMALATTAGVGSGWVGFTRTAPASGVDTATIQVTSAIGSREVRDVTTALEPRSVTLAPVVRERTMAVLSPVTDSLQVTLAGAGATVATWSASVAGDGITLTRAEGVGSGWVTFVRVALVEGLQDAAIQVTSDGVTATYLDRVVGSVPRTITLTPAARSRTALAGSVVRDSIWLGIVGSGAETATWSATQVGNLVLGSTSGSGSGWVFYQQTVPEGLVVSELRVTADGAVAVAVDSMRGTTPITLTITPTERTRSMTVGQVVTDSVAITLTGTGADTQAWTAVGTSGITVTRTTGTGSGYVTFDRAAAGEGTGSAVITVNVGGLTAAYTDIVNGEVPLGLALAPAGRSRQMAPNALVLDSVEVRLTGTLASTTTWSATSSSPRLVPMAAAGVGTAWLRFQRSSGSEGLEMASLIVAVGQQAASYHDSVTVLQPETIAVTPSGRVRSVRLDATVPVDSFLVTTAGGSGTLAWSASSGSPSLTVVPTSGTGSGWVRYTHSLSTVGESIASVQVFGGAATATFVDTLRRTAVPRTVALSPTGRRVVMLSGDSPLADSVSVQLGGTGATGAAWQATAVGVEVLTPSGVGSGWLRIQRVAAGTSGLSVGTVTVVSDGITATYADTVETQGPTQPTGGVQVSPSELATDAGYAIAVKKTLPVQVTIGGMDAATAVWRMRRLSGSAGRATVSSVWRTGSLEVGLSVATTTSTPPGTYVDSFVVERQDGKGTARLRHVMTVRGPTLGTLVFGRSGRVRQFQPTDRLVTTLSDTIHFTLTPPEGLTSLGWTARATGGLVVPWNRKKGSGTVGLTVVNRTVVPSVIGWTVDSVIVRTMGTDFVYLDSVYVGTDVPPVSGELGFVHPVTSRVHTVFSGGRSFTTYLPTKPVGPGSDTLPWRVRIYKADPGHANTWDPIRVGEVNTRIGISRQLPVGVHVDTIITAFLHDQRIQTVTLDSLIVLDAPLSRGAAKARVATPTTVMPTVITREDASLVVEGRVQATRSLEAGIAQWDLVAPDAPMGRSTIRVGEVSGEGEPVWRTLTIVRLEALPTRREIFGALRGGDPLVAAWIDALGDGDGRVTLGEVLRGLQQATIP